MKSLWTKDELLSLIADWKAALKAAARASHTAVPTGGRLAQPSRDAGAFRGSLVGWHGTQTHSRHQEHAERVRRGHTFSLSLQNLAPQRLMTPADMVVHDNIYDGVHLSAGGKPLGYYIAIPPSALDADTLAEYEKTHNAVLAVVEACVGREHFANIQTTLEKCAAAQLTPEQMTALATTLASIVPPCISPFLNGL